MQTESVANYQPNIDVLNLIAQDPNIVDISKRSLSATVRSEMEERLSAFFEEHPDQGGEGNGVSGTVSTGSVGVSDTGDSYDTTDTAETEDPSSNEYTDDSSGEASVVVDPAETTETPDTTATTDASSDANVVTIG